MSTQKPAPEDSLLQIEAELARQDREWEQAARQLEAFSGARLWLESLPGDPVEPQPAEILPPPFGVRA